MAKGKEILSLIALWLGQLPSSQYRAICALILFGWAIGFYFSFISPMRLQELSQTLSGNSLQAPSSLQALSQEQQLVRRQLEEIQTAIEVHQQVQSEMQSKVSEAAEDMVTFIDRASRQTALQVGALVSVGRIDSKSGTLRQRYQLTVLGRYDGIVDFVAQLSDEHSPIVVEEASITAPGWRYPTESLEARLTINVGHISANGPSHGAVS